MNKINSETLESLAHLYLYIAAIDDNLQEVEKFTVKQKLGERAAETEKDRIDYVIALAVNSLHAREQLQENIIKCVAVVNDDFDENNKIAVFKDIVEIALSDGSINDDERRTIRFLAQTWDLPQQADIDKYISEVIAELILKMKSSEDLLKEYNLTQEEIDKLESEEKDSPDASDKT